MMAVYNLYLLIAGVFTRAVYFPHRLQLTNFVL